MDKVIAEKKESGNESATLNTDELKEIFSDKLSARGWAESMIDERTHDFSRETGTDWKEARRILKDEDNYKLRGPKAKRTWLEAHQNLGKARLTLEEPYADIEAEYNADVETIKQDTEDK
jgi:hypothetical protein